MSLARVQTLVPQKKRKKKISLALAVFGRLAPSGRPMGLKGTRGCLEVANHGKMEAMEKMCGEKEG
jgi:hypothetical protein